MNADSDAGFERFASSFVRSYWRTVKDGVFPMPPDEPVEETLEELLASISFAIEPAKQGRRHFRMTAEAGDWWEFGFDFQRGAWKLARASARSETKNSPHNLLGEVYAPHFRPFLEHVANMANNHSE